MFKILSVVWVVIITGYVTEVHTAYVISHENKMLGTLKVIQKITFLLL